MLLFARAPNASLRETLTRRPIVVEQCLNGIVYRAPVGEITDGLGGKYHSSTSVVVRTFARQRIVVLGAVDEAQARSAYPLRGWKKYVASDHLIRNEHGWKFGPFFARQGDLIEFETAWA